jgi:hypothetical protein
MDDWLIGWLSIHCAPVVCHDSTQRPTYGSGEGRKVCLLSYFLIEFPPLLHSRIHLLCILLSSFHKRDYAEQVIKSRSHKKELYNLDDLRNWHGEFVREQSLDRDEAQWFTVPSDTHAVFRISTPKVPTEHATVRLSAGAAQHTYDPRIPPGLQIPETRWANQSRMPSRQIADATKMGNWGERP